MTIQSNETDEKIELFKQYYIFKICMVQFPKVLQEIITQYGGNDLIFKIYNMHEVQFRKHVRIYFDCADEK